MKKLLMFGVAFTLVFMMVAPALATDVSFSGSIRWRYLWHENVSLDKNSAMDEFMNMRFRLATTFKVNDILSVRTRFDALDGDKYGDGTETFNWDRSWMVIKTADYGQFELGRMGGGTWATSFADNDVDADRFKWTYTGIENWTLLALWEKNAGGELDGGNYAATARPTGNYVTDDASDQDSDDYIAAFVYKAEQWNAGFFYQFTNGKTAPLTASKTNLIMPYMVGQWGPFGLQMELQYLWGELDADDTNAAPTNVDVDVKWWTFNIDGTYNFGPARLRAGYAFVSGEDADATQVTAGGGTGPSWNEPLWIFGTDDMSWHNRMGYGTGNLALNGGGGGCNHWYIAGYFNPVETVTLGAAFGASTADDTSGAAAALGRAVDDDQGSEFDLTLDWKIYDNLKYKFVFAWWSEGEYYRDIGGIAATDFDDTKTAFMDLTLSF